jgi:hypothetical protein
MVEYVIIPFFFALNTYARLLKQVMWNETTSNTILIIEMQFDEFSKTTAIVVARGFGITKSFQ